MSDCSTNAFKHSGNLRTAVADLQRENARLADENAMLRECISDMWPRAAFTMSTVNRASWEERLRSLGIEADA